jgi:hypothetical protein
MEALKFDEPNQTNAVKEASYIRETTQTNRTPRGYVS